MISVLRSEARTVARSPAVYLVQNSSQILRYCCLPKFVFHRGTIRPGPRDGRGQPSSIARFPVRVKRPRPSTSNTGEEDRTCLLLLVTIFDERSPLRTSEETHRTECGVTRIGKHSSPQRKRCGVLCVDVVLSSLRAVTPGHSSPPQRLDPQTTVLMSTVRARRKSPPFVGWCALLGSASSMLPLTLHASSCSFSARDWL